jgi:hypothetical protein
MQSLSLDSGKVRARKGSRPRAIHDQRTQSTYLFGAVCPERGTGAALVLPACNSEAMQLHLDEIATKVTPGAHAIVLLDQAGWHGAKALKVPSNISLLLLPPRAPELNGQENVRQFMRQNWLSSGSSNPSTISSTTVATLATRSSISPGRLCPSRAGVGQRGLLNVRIGISPLSLCTSLPQAGVSFGQRRRGQGPAALAAA